MWPHLTYFIVAHSPFNTIHNWDQESLIEWVCGFLLTLQGPLNPTPALKQIKLQFHHLEGAVSCPNATLSPPPPPPTPTTYTRIHKNSTPQPHQNRSALPPPKKASFHCSIAERNGGIWGKKEGKGGWVVWEAKGIGCMHGDLIAASSQGNILLWRKRIEGGREGERLHCCGIQIVSDPRPPPSPPCSTLSRLKLS